MVDIYVGSENTRWTLHEKLLCYRSRFFSEVFEQKRKGASKNTMVGLPDEDNQSFKLFVGWLYSERVAPPKQEPELVPLFDLYLMSEKWEIEKLQSEVLEAVRQWYHASDTLPSLRRVQYIYANTRETSPMRHLLLPLVARMLLLNEGAMPSHWKNALSNNGELAVDIIECIHNWKFQPEKVPDARIEAMASRTDDVPAQVAVKREDDDDDEYKLDWSSGHLGPHDGDY
jgi:hypothetical protein